MAQQTRPTKRQQAPSLFVPPSRETSTADISQRVQEANAERTDKSRDEDVSLRDPTYARGGSTSSGPNGQLDKSRQSRPGKTDDKRVDLTWTEMQNTLEEVELNAASGANIFSSDHARALEDLRKAQIELAQAWTRGEEEDEADADVDLLKAQNVGPRTNKDDSGMRNLAQEDGHPRKDSKSAGTGTDGNRPRTSSTRDEPSLEEETQNDIRLARQRREANDRYFERVNKGVADVITKLETVASKMRDVETASQDIWNSEQESLAS